MSSRQPVCFSTLGGTDRSRGVRIHPAGQRRFDLLLGEGELSRLWRRVGRGEVTIFRVYANIDQGAGLAEIATAAARAEAMQYDGLFVPEAVHDGLLAAQAALAATARLHVATSVLVAFARSPMTVAVAAWDLASTYAGRFELGLGSQVRGNVERRFSMAFDPPVTRMREYVASLRAIWRAFQSGEPLSFEGSVYSFTRLQPFFNPGPIEHPDIPIFLGAVMPRMTELAGEVADGLMTHPTNSSPRYIDEVIAARMKRGAGRRDDGVTAAVISQCLVATGPDEPTVAARREEYRRLLGFLYSTPAYWPSLELYGWAELGPKLRQSARDGQWQEMTALIDDEILDTIVPSGPYETVVDELRRRFGNSVSHITVPLPADPRHDDAHAAAIARLHGPRG